MANKTPVLGFIASKILDWGEKIVDKSDNQVAPIAGQDLEQSETTQAVKQTPDVDTEAQELRIPDSKQVDVFYDPELESIYEKTTTNLLDSDSKVAQEWFVKFMNQSQKANNLQPLEAADVTSMICVAAKSESASEIVGSNVTRPMFLFTDDSQFKTFLKAINLEGAAGFAKGLQPKNTDKKLSFIVTGTDIAVAGHEFRHSIDYNLYNREGVGQLLGEMFAQYHDEIGIFGTNAADKNWKNLEQTMTLPTYYKQLLQNKPEISQLNKETYDEVIGLMVEQLRACYEKTSDHIFVQRLMLQSTSLQELLRKISDVVRG